MLAGFVAWYLVLMRTRLQVAAAKEEVFKLLDDVDAVLSGPDAKPFLTGDHFSFVDATFCALTAPMMPRCFLFAKQGGEGGSIWPDGLDRPSMWARGRFAFGTQGDSRARTSAESIALVWPTELVKLEEEVLARPCGKFVLTMYKTYRRKVLVAK